MRIIPVSLALFYEFTNNVLKLWVQVRTDDGPYHGLLEFPGGGIENNESPMDAAKREVFEEVGISIDHLSGELMGVYLNQFPGKTIQLYVHLFPVIPELEGRGQYLEIAAEKMSAPFQGLIPGPNHKIIDDLYLALQKRVHSW